MKNTIGQNKGITLIALVITIIVLLILAGITIAMLSGENGILTRGQSTRMYNDYYSAEEQVRLAYMAVKTEIMAKKASNGTYDARTEINEYVTMVRKDLSDTSKWTEVDKRGTTDTIYITYTSASLKQGGIKADTPKQNGKVESTISLTNNGKDATVEFDIGAGGANSGEIPETPTSPISIIVTEMSIDEINQKGIQFEYDDSVIIKVREDINSPTEATFNSYSELKKQEMFMIAYNIFNSQETWEQIVERDNVSTAAEAFEAEKEYVSELNDYSSLYDLILQTGVINVDDLHQLKYTCNNVEKTGKEVYFELTEEKEYDIVAKDENNNVVGSTSYILEIHHENIVLGAMLFLQNGTGISIEDYAGKTWYEFATDPNNTISYPTINLGENCDLKDIIIGCQDFISWARAYGKIRSLDTNSSGFGNQYCTSTIESGRVYYEVQYE